VIQPTLPNALAPSEEDIPGRNWYARADGKNLCLVRRRSGTCRRLHYTRTWSSIWRPVDESSSRAAARGM